MLDRNGLTFGRLLHYANWTHFLPVVLRVISPSVSIPIFSRGKITIYFKRDSLFPLSNIEPMNVVMDKLWVTSTDEPTIHPPPELSKINNKYSLFCTLHKLPFLILLTMYAQISNRLFSSYIILHLSLVWKGIIHFVSVLMPYSISLSRQYSSAESIAPSRVL